MRFGCGLELLVVIVAVIQCIGFIITYILAAYYGHLTPFFPYISNTGGKPPESCIFTLICSISSIIWLLIIYIRYIQVKQYYQKDINRIKFLNQFTFFIGAVSVFGLLLVGSFQDHNVNAKVHMIGAFTLWIFGILHMWFQTLVSYKIYHTGLTRRIDKVNIFGRLIISLMAVIISIIGLISMKVSEQQRVHKEGQYDPFYWDSSVVGYPLHLTSTISEWCLGLTFVLFFLTFHVDFYRASLNVSFVSPTQSQEEQVSVSMNKEPLNERTPLVAVLNSN
ncbi:PREDICTED: DNA damage-regulated autophagy modulator protein 1-like [Amphimedon queenslandica]|uniref:CWH43-like N-terminal domain-containing protein n=2 Tax=Amphimedon queenslandica TaxID=400682 RepID=A0AAN0JSW7_AMPQE|nr:PREDICTED: DNA damage-regulated autophagy modulator protein 1-like [Amphimedon queenslandica]|eukprot:XP_019860212.1 PREDICTED: DNA damage-regulated autophagy modulator protein 1-like [Amphimedon queenslandica]